MLAVALVEVTFIWQRILMSMLWASIDLLDVRGVKKIDGLESLYLKHARQLLAYERKLKIIGPLCCFSRQETKYCPTNFGATSICSLSQMSVWEKKKMTKNPSTTYH